MFCHMHCSALVMCTLVQALDAEPPTLLLLPLVNMQREEGERRWRSNKGLDPPHPTPMLLQRCLCILPGRGSGPGFLQFKGGVRPLALLLN